MRLRAWFAAAVSVAHWCSRWGRAWAIPLRSAGSVILIPAFSSAFWVIRTEDEHEVVDSLGHEDPAPRYAVSLLEPLEESGP
jgi:hypothetical protein